MFGIHTSRAELPLRALRWKRGGYRVVRHMLTWAVFDEWLATDGRDVVARRRDRLRLRWIFGERRARRALYREARTALAPQRGFAVCARRCVNDLPALIRRLGAQIQRRSYRDLFTVDTDVALVSVPRAIVQHELSRLLIDHLGHAGPLQNFPGLPARICRLASAEAEQHLCDYLSRGKQHKFEDGKALLLGVSDEFRWGFHEMDGHYYCAYASRSGRNLDLNRWRDARRFTSEISTILDAHQTHLQRLDQERRERVVAELRGFSTRAVTRLDTKIEVVEAYHPRVFTS